MTQNSFKPSAHKNGSKPY